MTTFYDIIDKMKTYLQGNNNINTVTFGDIFEVDLAKQTIFPLAHIIVNSCTFQEHVVRFNMQIICMDIVQDTNEDLKDQSNYFNTMFFVVNGLQSALRRGEMYSDLFQIDSDFDAQMFEDRFENLLAGWSLTLDVIVPNNQISDINSNGQSAC